MGTKLYVSSLGCSSNGCVLKSQRLWALYSPTVHTCFPPKMHAISWYPQINRSHLFKNCWKTMVSLASRATWQAGSQQRVLSIMNPKDVEGELDHCCSTTQATRCLLGLHFVTFAKQSEYGTEVAYVPDIFGFQGPCGLIEQETDP